MRAHLHLFARPLSAVLFLALAAGADADEHRHHREALDHKAGADASQLEAPALPDVPLLDQDGNRVWFYSDLVAGKVVVINFVFTTCTTICPPMGAIFARLQQELPAEAAEEVRLISVSIDPRVDSPERLASWSRKFGRRPGWTLLTGDKQDVDRVLKALEVFTPDKADHAPLVLVGDDRTGNWRRAYGLAPASTLEQLVADLRALRSSEALGAGR